MHLGDTGVHAPAIPLSFLRLVSYVFYVYDMLYAFHVLVKEQGNPDGESPVEPPQYGRMYLGDTGVHAPTVSPSLLRLDLYVFMYVCYVVCLACAS